MSQQEGALKGGGKQAKTTHDGKEPDPEQSTREDCSSADLLAYMSDLIAELRSISDRQGWRTLSGILALAQAEAAARQESLNLPRRR